MATIKLPKIALGAWAWGNATAAAGTVVYPFNTHADSGRYA